MSKSKKPPTTKIVDENGKIVLVHTEERFPYGTEILMRSGFLIILLNMAFGLLPTTLNGTSLKYLRCSVAQFYAIVFGLCVISLSFIFIPVVMMEDVSKSTGTGIAVIILIRVTHVVGFILLLIRGHSVAKKMPLIWNQLAKLVQISIVEVHGRKYHFIKSISSYAKWSLFYYILVMSLSQIETYFLQMKSTLPNFYFYYHLPPVLPKWIAFTMKAGFLIWQFCSLSHILVSMLVCYLLVVIKACLRSTSDLLMTMFEDSSSTRSHPLLNRKRPLVKIRSESNINIEDEFLIVEKLNRIKDVMVVAEDVTSNISKVWGVSLIFEVLILIANTLVNLYYLLVGIKPNNQRNIVTNTDLVDLEYNPWDQTLSLLSEVTIHSYFFYRLCCVSTEMVNEAKEPLQILKSIQYHKYSRRVQEAIQSLKSDLSSTTINLTASNYFQINKFLLTSVTGAITTYIIVLLQFQAQDNAKVRF